MSGSHYEYVYLVIEATKYGAAQYVSKIRVVKMLKDPPERLGRNQIYVKVKVTVPDDAFIVEPLTAEVVIPTDVVKYQIDVEAEEIQDVG